MCVCVGGGIQISAQLQFFCIDNGRNFTSTSKNLNYPTGGNLWDDSIFLKLKLK